MKPLFNIILPMMLVAACNTQSPAESIEVFQGPVFGSTFSIKLRGKIAREEFQKNLDQFFTDFNHEFSTYHPDSVISKFNKMNSHEKLHVSPRFIKMLELAQSLNKKTHGAFDPTLGPVIEAWGFNGKSPKVPTESELLKARSQTGLHKIKWTVNQVWKTDPNIKMNINAFAPGWAADLIGEDLEKLGIQNYMVDIGGEIRVRGNKSDRSPWVIGIERPAESLEHSLYTSLKISSLSIATSGDYRQYFNDQGKRKSHIIDPRSGRPVEHRVSSVTVMASSAAEADAWGTALMVLGEEGLKLAEENQIKVMMLKGNENRTFDKITSLSMQTYLKENEVR